MEVLFGHLTDGKRNTYMIKGLRKAVKLKCCRLGFLPVSDNL